MGLDREAIKRAMGSSDAGRLLEIAREHAQLLKEITRNDSNGYPVSIMYDPLTKGIYDERMWQLQNERDEILKRYV